MQPGRVASRPVPASLFRLSSRRRVRLALGLAALLGAACATREPPDPELDRLWEQYSALPPQRALAIAGDLRTSRWVAGATGGHASRDAAVAAAFQECRRRRAERRFQDACGLYAVGDEIVRSGSPSSGR